MGIPVTKMIDLNGNECVVNLADAAIWLAKGYKMPGEKVEAPKVATGRAAAAAATASASAAK